MKSIFGGALYFAGAVFLFCFVLFSILANKTSNINGIIIIFESALIAYLIFMAIYRIKTKP